MTDSRPDSDSTPQKPRGLWSLMGGAEPPQTQPDAEPQNSPSDETPTVPATAPAFSPASAPEAAETRPRQRGLWGMMQQTSAEAPQTTRAAEETESASDSGRVENSPAGDAVPPKAPASRSLFAVMQRADGGDPGVSRTGVEDVPQTPEGRSAGIGSRSTAESQSEIAVTRVPGHTDSRSDREREATETRERAVASAALELINPEDLEPTKYLLAIRQARRQTWLGLTMGFLAIVASALSLLPNFLASLPATAMGFVAIIACYLALTGPARRENSLSTRSLSIVGMLLGTAGVFLGPLLFAGIGRSMRDQTGNQSTRKHLQALSVGLDHHYAEHDGYPVGGRFDRNEAGTIRGQHGWMTFLLPYVGEADLYREIDLSKPFDDPVNRNAMGKNVNIYFAGGGDRSRLGDGFSVSHFAGLGGEIDEGGTLAHVGIFERDVGVKREEITDGLSNTLIIGELAGVYPPWGDPENWRTIGRGLNKDVNGFGSATGNGATFLLADGTVRFFSNKTDPRLLEKLSTRDGGE